MKDEPAQRLRKVTWHNNLVRFRFSSLNKLVERTARWCWFRRWWRLGVVWGGVTSGRETVLQRQRVHQRCLRRILWIA